VVRAVIREVLIPESASSPGAGRRRGGQSGICSGYVWRDDWYMVQDRGLPGLDRGSALRTIICLRAIEIADEHAGRVCAVEGNDSLVVDTPDFHIGLIGNCQLGEVPAFDIIGEAVPAAGCIGIEPADGALVVDALEIGDAAGVVDGRVEERGSLIASSESTPSFRPSLPGPWFSS
jgi:hypothetical protein